jgi:hypothetical protein
MREKKSYKNQTTRKQHNSLSLSKLFFYYPQTKQQQKSSSITTAKTTVLRDDSPKLDFDDGFHARSDRESGENERRDFF